MVTACKTQYETENLTIRVQNENNMTNSRNQNDLT